MKLARVVHWELAVAVQCGALAAWLLAAGLFWSLVASGVGLLSFAAAAARRRVLPVLVVVAGLAASLYALGVSWRVWQVEVAWDELREQLIQSAGDVLEQSLLDAVTLATSLADSAVSAVATADAFELLAATVDQDGVEHGVVVLDSSGNSLAWAGSHRVLPVPSGQAVSARITPFYVILEAERQQGPYLGIGQVVLAADSAVPDRDRTLSARFSRETGAALEFFDPMLAPDQEDVFDYYLEGLSPPDTLFSILTIPPSQGTYKLKILDHGLARVTLLTLATLLLLIASARAPGRWVGLVGAAAILIFTPAGRGLGPGGLFSGATFYLDALGPLSNSAGSLLTLSTLLVIALVPFLGRAFRWRLAGIIAAAVLVPMHPLIMSYLASGITPPATGLGVGLWLSWQAALSVAGAVMLLLIARLLKGSHGRKTPAWVAWLAGGWAVMAALLGVYLWDPVTGTPAWLALLWVLPVALAALPSPAFRRVTVVSVVTGTSAALFIWTSVAESRLVLAERDVTRASGGDPFARGLLDEFGSQLLEGDAPRTAAALYAAWRNSALSIDDFPAVLTTWGPDGQLQARLDLAKLDLSAELLEDEADIARDSATSLETGVVIPPTVFVRSVPFPDGSVVSVAVGPISRLIEPLRIARFLRGERRLVVSYEMSLGGLTAAAEGGTRTLWERSGWAVRGLGTMTPSEGLHYQVHVHVPLGSLGGTALRGILVVFWTFLLIGSFWLVAEALAGRLRVRPMSEPGIWFRSYRIRLAIALASFFILPTIAFATWSIVRLRVTTAHSGDIVIEETLADAANTARFFAALAPDTMQLRLNDLADQLNADLLWYQDGVLQYSSPSALAELGLVDRYLPAQVYQQLVTDEEPSVTVDEVMGGHPTRVGFHTLSGLNAVLGAPRLVDVRDIQSGREDLLFGLLLATLFGLGAAAKLAAIAAASLAKPVRSLRSAAVAVGRGEALQGFEPGAPTEFVPVFEAFERMAADIVASQSALEHARRRTAAVLRNVATAVVALDPQLRVTIANPRAEQLLGTELPPGSRVDATAGPEWMSVWEWVRNYLKGELESDSIELTVAASQIRAQIATIRGTPGGCVLALDDTTELTRAVRIIAWGELARQIAHEIKNPLTPIRLGIQHLSRAYHDGQSGFRTTLDRTAKQILAEIERLDAIARAFSRFGAPPAEAEPLTNVALGAIAKDAVGLYTLSLGPKVTVEADGAAVGWVRKDELKEVLVNLIENARDAGARSITVSVTQQDDGATIRVTDDGSGIPAEDLSQVFEPQFSTTTSGTGLGLAICRRLVESWGGDIRVESEQGAGTVVTMIVGGPKPRS